MESYIKYISKNNIINKEFYEAHKKYINCCRCSNISISPLICSKCKYIFCIKCINENKGKKKICPNNCENNNYEKNYFIIYILSQLNFKCLYCENNINYNEVENHYKYYCHSKINESISDINFINNKKTEMLNTYQISRYKELGFLVSDINCKNKYF